MLALRKPSGARGAGLLSRLHAWWEGDEPSSSSAKELALVDEGDLSDTAPGEIRQWTRRRLRAAQRLCGAGRLSPGDAEIIGPQIARLSLQDGQRVAIANAGLGELARDVAGTAGVSITCLDQDPVLVRAAGELLGETELGERVSILQGRFDEGQLPERSCDAIVAREALLEIPNKADALRALHAILKPGGELLIGDFMSRAQNDATLEISVWSAFERTEPHLINAEEFHSILVEFSYDAAEPVDLSQAYAQTILQSLHRFAEELEDKPVSDDLRPWVMWEVEYWARRVQMLEDGGIGYYAFLAKSPAEDEG